jgi:hypothetical protein
MTTIVGRDIKVEVALTFATAAALTAITKASPGVASKTAHGIADGTVGYLSIAAGMVEAHEQAVMTDNAATDTFELAGLNTTNYSTFTAGDLIAAATWGVITEAYNYNLPDAAAAQIDDTRLTDIKTRNVAGLLGSQDLTVQIRSPETMSAALAYVASQAIGGGKILVKITKVSTSTVLRVAYGTPSLPGENVDVGAGGTGSFNIIVPAFPLKPNV